jgi:hypothetical protein
MSDTAAAMLDWRWWKGARSPGEVPGKARGPAVPAAGGDEWSYLRCQPDHDADEMAQVHGPGTSGTRAREVAAPRGTDLAEEVTGAPLRERVSREADVGARLSPESAITDEDRLLFDLARAALGLPEAAPDGNGSDPTADPQWDRASPALNARDLAGGDVLDLALGRGEAAGLLPRATPGAGNRTPVARPGDGPGTKQ